MTDDQKRAVALLVVAGFCLTPGDIADLAAAIASARLAAYSAALDDAIAALPDDIELDIDPSDLTETLLADATVTAQGIATTLQRDLTQDALIFALVWAGADADLAGALRTHLDAYSRTRAETKADQIARYETLSAADDATRDTIDALVAHAVTDALDDLVVRVVPDLGSPDCQQYTGRDWTLEEAQNLPPFPKHPNCPHTTILTRRT